ncbi:hypothetical protein DES53_105150 [Roseimicrobium gellanilyticum]|uniref:GlcNAc-PI de-N-acetylase n=2 Tax=Roseimicrobium gellanilyticum TaxID=748857 RepID=A0A366HNE5_9BACT|nr:hypothetical protein DES53_105150 [Roseimicrobium gellanilyticum]
MSSLLVVSHPGHELRLHHWLEVERPEVFVLTDGSGSTMRSRMASTRRLIEGAGSTLALQSGERTDAEMYTALRTQDRAFFRAIFDAISNLMARADVDTVVCDAVEGYNTSHDLCFQLVLSAVRAQRRPILVRDFLLVGRPDTIPTGECTVHRLDEQALQRKLDAASHYPELAAEIQSAVEIFGREAFATEVLRHVGNPSVPIPPPSLPPYYETYGEKRVREGVYSMVIRHEIHVGPMSEEIWKWADGV